MEGSREQTPALRSALGDCGLRGSVTMRPWATYLRTFARCYTKLQIRLFAPETHSEPAPAATSASVCFSFSTSIGKPNEDPHATAHARHTHTPSPEAPPVRTLRASDPALRRGNPRAGARRASRASPVHCSHHSRAFPRTWCHPGPPTLSRGAQLCTRQRSLLVQAPSAPQKDRPAHSFLPDILFKPRKAKPFPTCDENFFLFPQRNKAGDQGGRCG